MSGRNYLQNIFFLDRLDYTSVITQAHAYCLCVEQLILFTHKNLFNLGFRTLFDELARVLNHLLAVSTHALDIGTMSPLFWAFEEREQVMELCEYVTGARMHVAIYVPFEDSTGVLNINFLGKLVYFLKNAVKTFSELYLALVENRV
jgi:NADH:ubiquinone oxidoreductase subunit D